MRTSGRYMGITIGAMLEEIQGLYQQHHQSCFLYLSSEVIKVYFSLFKLQAADYKYFFYKSCIFYLVLQIFGSDPSCANYLKSLIEALFMQTTRLLTNIQVKFQ